MKRTSIVGDFLIFAALTSTSLAQTNLNPEGKGCVDPKGYVDCYAAQETQLISCMDFAKKNCAAGDAYNNCVLGCGGAQLAGNVGCWVQSCWNQFYSCEYQETAIQYLAGTDLVQATVDLPFYPPPDGSLPGGCSCNLGNVYGNITFIDPYDPCLDYDVVQSIQTAADCSCCAETILVSNALNLCPNSDLSQLGFNTTLSNIQQSLEGASSDGCAALNSDPALCTTSYTFPYVGSTIYNPLSLPTGIPGTEALFNSPGTAFTTFVDEYTLMLFPGFTSTITPAKYDAVNTATPVETESGGAATSAGGAAGSAATATGTDASAGSSAGTGTGAAASPSTTKSAAGQIVISGRNCILALSVFLGIAML